MSRRVVWAAVGSAALALSMLGAGPTSTAAEPDPPWLARLNDVRVASGLRAVTNNLEWSAGIANHLLYLEHESGGPLVSGEYASWHTENPASSYYTSAGAYEAARSNLATGPLTTTDVEFIDVWLTAPFHALGMLRPTLSEVAFASRPGWAGLDVLGALAGSVTTDQVLFPGDGSTTDLRTYSGFEAPNPLETCTHEDKSPPFDGLPLIVMMPEELPASGVTGYLRLPDGTLESSAGPDLCLVYSGNYWSTDPTYGTNGGYALERDHAAFLIPRAPLRDGRYTATLDIPGAASVVWSFTVADKPPPPDPPAPPGPPPSGPPPTPGTLEIRNVATPSIHGKARVKRTLRAKPGRWTPSEVVFHYRWFRDGARIPRAHATTYQLRKADRGHHLTIRVRATRAGYEDPGWIKSPRTPKVRKR